MKKNLKIPQKEAQEEKVSRQKKRSFSFSFGERRPSVHWISPSVFNSEPPTTTIANNPDTDHIATLSQVFNGPFTDSQANPCPAKKKARKRNELPKAKAENTNNSKRFKKEPATKNENEKPEFVKMEKKCKPQTKRLSYILNNDPYNVLGVSPSASKSIMKNAYKRKAIDAHPDKGGSEDEFIKLKTAYEILVDDGYEAVWINEK